MCCGYVSYGSTDWVVEFVCLVVGVRALYGLLFEYGVSSVVCIEAVCRIPCAMVPCAMVPCAMMPCVEYRVQWCRVQ